MRSPASPSASRARETCATSSDPARVRWAGSGRAASSRRTRDRVAPGRSTRSNGGRADVSRERARRGGREVLEKKGQQEWSSSSASSPRVTCSAASSSRLAVCPRLSVWCSSSSSVAAATSNALSATRRAAAEDASVCRRRPATRRSATERRDTPPEKGGGSPDEDARAPPRENHRERDIAHAPSARSSPTRARPRSPHDSTPTASASPRWSSVVSYRFSSLSYRDRTSETTR